MVLFGRKSVLIVRGGYARRSTWLRGSVCAGILLMTPATVDFITLPSVLPLEVCMAKFEAAIPLVLQHEGGYVNDPTDPGGETNYGISKRSYPDIDITNLTQEQAKEIYERDFWDKTWNDIMSQDMATTLLDASVNMGRTAAVKLLQQSVNHVYGKALLEVDGVFGTHTLNAVNAASEEVLREFRASRTIFYVDLAWEKPTMKKFLAGWIRRAVV